MKSFLVLLCAVTISLAADSASVPDTFLAPKLRLYSFYLPNPTSIQIIIYDLSNCETGYRVYRDSGDASTAHLKLLAQVQSVVPAHHDTISFMDYSVIPYHYYYYEVASYRDNDSIFSAPIGVYPIVNTEFITKSNCLLHQELRVISDQHHGIVTLYLPTNDVSHANLVFFDLSGHIVDKVTNIKSNKVVWRPKRISRGCYIVSAMIDGKQYKAKFVIR